MRSRTCWQWLHCPLSQGLPGAPLPRPHVRWLTSTAILRRSKPSRSKVAERHGVRRPDDGVASAIGTTSPNPQHRASGNYSAGPTATSPDRNSKHWLTRHTPPRQPGNGTTRLGQGIGRHYRENVLRSNRFISIVNDHLTSIKQAHLSRFLAPPDDYDAFAEYAQSEARAAVFQSKTGIVPSDPSASDSLASQLIARYLDEGDKALTPLLKDRHRQFLLDEQYRDLGARTSKLLDFRHPAEWFPAARELQRTIHLHVGPTNSGKTYQALKRLEESKSGFYAGPLRLLAHEVYARLNAKGIPCGLITGDEVRYPDQDEQRCRIFSNTVEMVPLGQEVEVGVVDEIQMIADEFRGWAWTRAVLGARAKELHLCGEERAVPLIKKLAASTGDRVVVHTYARLNPLRAMDVSLKGNLARLEKGDCVVAFSRLNIHALKNAIEKATGRRCAVVYGSLPAEIRSQQAALFNDPDNDYDFLVASDAIGMGLNLSVKRIIFETTVKRLATGYERLSVSQIKQIGGRAGRYRVPSKTGGGGGGGGQASAGLVTCLEDVDLPYIQQALAAEAAPIDRAGLLPLDNMIRAFADHFGPDTPFSYVLQKMFRLARLDDADYFLCSTQPHVRIGDLLEGITGLTVNDMLVFTAAPLPSSKLMDNVARVFARCVAEDSDGHLLDIDQLNLPILNQPVSDDSLYLRGLEQLHRALVLYLWLSFRAGGVFTDRALATHVRDITEGTVVHIARGQPISIIPSLLNATLLALLAAAIPLKMTFTAVLVAATRDGRLLRDPRPDEIRAAASLHALAFASTGRLLYTADEGRFDLPTYDAVYELAESACLAAAKRTGGDEDGGGDVQMDAPTAEEQQSLDTFVRNVVEDKVREDMAWRIAAA
ncbi:RNA helicase [Ascosphaera acerosa]|nr:RNA helicase [Ascosphaera acerosa]